jgi:hypothetical protein
MKGWKVARKQFYETVWAQAALVLCAELALMLSKIYVLLNAKHPLPLDLKMQCAFINYLVIVIFIVMLGLLWCLFHEDHLEISDDDGHRQNNSDAHATGEFFAASNWFSIDEQYMNRIFNHFELRELMSE